MSAYNETNFNKLLDAEAEIVQLRRKIKVLDRCHLSSQKYTARLSNALNESEAEVVSWKSKAFEAEDREGKHEAEVERLTNELAQSQFQLKTTQSALDQMTEDAINNKTQEVERLGEQMERLASDVYRVLTGKKEGVNEVKEIRAALGDDGRRTHKEVLELATKASQWRKWKEKYIALKNAHIAEGQDPSGTIWEHADKLQAELKASKAEIERLKQEKNRIGVDIRGEYLPKLKELQAEVEKLQKELNDSNDNLMRTHD
jgi:chromosome segregation ATPase